MAEYYIPLNHDSAVMLDMAGRNFVNFFGRKMKIPPRLFEDAKNFGVNMKNFESVASLKNWEEPHDI